MSEASTPMPTKWQSVRHDGFFGSQVYLIPGHGIERREMLRIIGRYTDECFLTPSGPK